MVQASKPSYIIHGGIHLSRSLSVFILYIWGFIEAKLTSSVHWMASTKEVWHGEMLLTYILLVGFQEFGMAILLQENWRGRIFSNNLEHLRRDLQAHNWRKATQLACRVNECINERKSRPASCCCGCCRRCMQLVPLVMCICMHGWPAGAGVSRTVHLSEPQTCSAGIYVGLPDPRPAPNLNAGP